MSKEDFDRLHQIRQGQGYERASAAPNEFVADAIAEQERKESEKTSRELASAIESYKAKQAEIAKVEERLALVSARISQKNTTPELRGSAMEMRSLVEAVKEALEFELRKLGETILTMDPKADLDAHKAQ